MIVTRLTRLPTYSITVGTFVWLAVLALSLMGDVGVSSLNLLLLLAVLVLAPLALYLVAHPTRIPNCHRLYTAAVVLQPMAAIPAVVALLLPPGMLASLLVLPWFIFVLVTAGSGLIWLAHHWEVAEERVIGFGLLYVAIGGIWLFFSRAGSPLFAFGEPIITLTAIHFHYISLAALIITGMTGRFLRQSDLPAFRLYSPAAAGMILGPILVALGITFSVLLEAIGTILLAVSLSLVAVMILARVVPVAGISWSSALLVVSAVSVLLAMLFATAYALGRLTGGWTITIPTMIRVHGWLNALGFALPGLIAWALSPPRAHVPAAGVPFSRLRGSGFIGPRFFDEILVPAVDDELTGLVDNLDDYQRADFPVTELSPEIRAFYERTAEHSLLVVPAWQPGFRTLSRLYKWLSVRVGQMNLPLEPESEEDHITSQIVPLDDRRDGRNRVRAWIRTYTKTGAAVYVAAYATHRHEGQSYMNIAFPLPGGNLTSILRLALLDRDDLEAGLLLTSLHDGLQIGDEGVYFSSPLLTVRLPINETISVWSVEANKDRDYVNHPVPAGTTVAARHDMWLLGIHFLTLHYFIYPAPKLDF